jgi:hypothetical protein
MILTVAAGLIATSAHTQTSDKPTTSSEDVILGAWSDPAKCNRANAAHLTFDEVFARCEKLNGNRVAIEGFWASRALFKREQQGNAARSNVTRSFRNRRIGIYARAELLENAPQRSARYMMVGVIGQCETEWPDAMMVLGYCHYTGGPILKVAEAMPLQTASGS